jgi:hypothetical protein
MGEEKKSFYITPTLLSSFEYYFNSDFEETEEEEDGKSETNLKDKVFNDFLNTLRKIKTPPPEAIIRGINFENDVRIYAETGLLPSIDDNNKENRIEAIQTIGNIVKGGLWQVVLQKEITLNNRKLGLDNTTFLLYGKADVIKENIIYDVKTTSSYDIGKYTNSPQHLLYSILKIH